MRAICLLAILASLLTLGASNYALDAAQPHTCAASPSKLKTDDKKEVRKIYPQAEEALKNAASWVAEAEKYTAEFFAKPFPEIPAPPPPKRSPMLGPSPPRFPNINIERMQFPLELAKYQALSGDREGATRLFKRIAEHLYKNNKPSEHRTKILDTTILREIASAGLHNLALELLKMSDKKSQSGLHGYIADAEMRSGLYYDAVKTCRIIETEYGADVTHTYRTIIKWALAAGKTEAAKKAAGLMTGDCKNEALIKIASHEAIHGNTEVAKKTFLRAISEAKSNAPRRIDIAAAAAKAGLKDVVKIAMTNVTTTSFNDDYVMLLHLAEVEAAIGKTTDAVALLKRAKDVFSQTTCKDAAEKVREICRVAEAEAGVTGREAALATFKKAAEYAARNVDKYFVGHTVAIQMAEAGFYKEAKERILALALPPHDKDWMLQRVAIIEAARDLCDQALATAKLIKDPCMRWSAVGPIIAAHTQAGRFEDARKLLEFVDQRGRACDEMGILEMELAAGETKHLKDAIEKQIAGNGIVTAKLLARIGMKDHLKKLYASITDKRNRAYMCLYAIKGYTQRAEDIKRAAEQGKLPPKPAEEKEEEPEAPAKSQ